MTWRLAGRGRIREKPPRLDVRVYDRSDVFAISPDTILRAVRRGELTNYKPVGVRLVPSRDRGWEARALFEQLPSNEEPDDDRAQP